jgi:hypothetical protein
VRCRHAVHAKYVTHCSCCIFLCSFVMQYGSLYYVDNCVCVCVVCQRASCSVCAPVLHHHTAHNTCLSPRLPFTVQWSTSYTQPLVIRTAAATAYCTSHIETTATNRISPARPSLLDIQSFVINIKTTTATSVCCYCTPTPVLVT